MHARAFVTQSQFQSKSLLTKSDFRNRIIPWVSWRTLKESQCTGRGSASRPLSSRLQLLVIRKSFARFSSQTPHQSPAPHPPAPPESAPRPCPHPALPSHSHHSLSKPALPSSQACFQNAQEYSGKHLSSAYEGRGEPKGFFFPFAAYAKHFHSNVS